MWCYRVFRFSDIQESHLGQVGNHGSSVCTHQTIKNCGVGGKWREELWCWWRERKLWRDPEGTEKCSGGNGRTSEVWATVSYKQNRLGFLLSEELYTLLTSVSYSRVACLLPPELRIVLVKLWCSDFQPEILVPEELWAVISSEPRLWILTERRSWITKQEHIPAPPVCPPCLLNCKIAVIPAPPSWYCCEEETR